MLNETIDVRALHLANRVCPLDEVCEGMLSLLLELDSVPGACPRFLAQEQAAQFVFRLSEELCAILNPAQFSPIGMQGGEHLNQFNRSLLLQIQNVLNGESLGDSIVELVLEHTFSALHGFDNWRESARQHDVSGFGQFRNAVRDFCCQFREVEAGILRELALLQPPQGNALASMDELFRFVKTLVGDVFPVQVVVDFLDGAK